MMTIAVIKFGLVWEPNASMNKINKESNNKLIQILSVGMPHKAFENMNITKTWFYSKKS